jgi:hypothetical protein
MLNARVVKTLAESSSAALICILVVQMAFYAVGTSFRAQEAKDVPAYQVKESVSGRVEAQSPAEPLNLEEENEVPIQLHGYKVHAIYASLEYYDATNDLLYSDDAEEVVSHHSDGSAYLDVIPEKVGHLKLHLQVQFEDGGAESTTMETDVVLPDREPEKILVARGGSGYSRTVGTMYLDLSGARSTWLEPLAVYEGAAHPVPLPAKYVHFSIIASNGMDSPIVIDQSTGEVTARGIGHALVETTFGTLSVLTCIDVKMLASDGSERSDCHELVPAGMVPPPTGLEGKKPPSKIVVPTQSR